MRSLLRPLCLAVAAVALCAAPAPAQQVVNAINGIGLVDYSRPPDFKVGDWVRYHMTGSSVMGMRDDYTVTVVIAGEEEFWGEPCVWIETWTEAAGRPPEALASLMSYSIFMDSLAVPRLQMYMRKVIDGVDDAGRPLQQVMKRSTSSLKSRNLAPRPLQWDVDTLAADTVITPKGTFRAVPVSIRQGTGVEQVVGDSTFYNEQRENRKIYYATEVPITHVAREDVESVVARRSYMIGRSSEGAPLRIRERALGTARLVDFGHGAQPRLIPEKFRSSMAAQRAAEGPPRTARPAAARKRGG